MYLIIGGAGFIGSHTVEALLASGRRVRVLDNFSSGREENLPSHPLLEIQAGDIRNADDVARAMAGMSHVLHLAAQVSVQASVEAPGDSCAHNIHGFVNVLDAARRQGVKRFVYASSAAVYGTPQALPLTEASPLAPESPYGLEKAVNDHYAALFRRLYGFASLGLRYFNVYGPRQDPRSPYAGVISKFADCMAAGKPLTVFGDGQQTRDFIFVKDVAAANMKALETGLTGVCNIGTGASVTLLQLIDALGDIVGRSLEVVHAEARPGDIRDSACDTSVMVKELGYRARYSLAEGLAELLSQHS
jgi:UDP-glucose 4-epimerase